MAAQLSQLLEAHTFYPLLHYFHFHHSRYALPRLALIVMDRASLLQSLPIPGRETAVAAQHEMQNACRDLLERAKEDFLHWYQPVDYPATAADLEEWRRHYREAARRLREAGVALPGELGDGEAVYLALRRDWHPYIVAFSRSLGYELDEVIPHP